VDADEHHVRLGGFGNPLAVTEAIHLRIERGLGSRRFLVVYQRVSGSACDHKKYRHTGDEPADFRNHKSGHTRNFAEINESAMPYARAENAGPSK
jgi:hypothetical protein